MDALTRKCTVMVWSDCSSAATEQLLHPNPCHFVFNLAVMFLL